MSGLSPTLTSLSGVASFLMRLLEEVPEWQGVTKTEFDRQLSELLHRLEDAEARIALVTVAEIAAETALEVGLL